MFNNTVIYSITVYLVQHQVNVINLKKTKTILYNTKRSNFGE